MQNNAEAIIREIKRKIPSTVLRMAMMREDVGQPSIESALMQEVISGILLPAANTYGGKTKEIILQQDYRLDAELLPEEHRFVQPHCSAYLVPPEVRENRNIAAVHQVSLPNNSLGIGNGYDYPNFDTAAAQQSLPSLSAAVLDSQTYERGPIKPNVKLITGNIVMLDQYYITYDRWVLSCSLEYDRYFTNANQDLLPVLKQLGVLAAKGYIYNNIYLMLGTVEMMGGQAHSRISDIIRGYEGADEKFDEMLPKLQGAMVLEPDLLKSIAKFSF